MASQEKNGLVVFIVADFGFGFDPKFPNGAYVISSCQGIPDAERIDQQNGRGARDGKVQQGLVVINADHNTEQGIWNQMRGQAGHDFRDASDILAACAKINTVLQKNQIKHFSKAVGVNRQLSKADFLDSLPPWLTESVSALFE